MQRGIGRLRAGGSRLGPELATGTGSAAGTWTIVGGVITRNSSATGQASDGAVTNSTATYRVSFTAAGMSGDTFFVRTGGTSGPQILVNGTYSYNITATSAASVFSAAPWGGFAGEVAITNYSVRAIT